MTNRECSEVAGHERAAATVTVRMSVGGNIIERHDVDDVIAVVESRMDSTTVGSLAVGSVNLDHLHYFGREDALRHQPGLEWLLLADGMPIAWRGQLLTARPWPRVTGADLLPRVLELAERRGYRVGFLGGTPQTHELLAARLADGHPRLAVAGMWAPDPHELEMYSKEIAEAIRAAHTDILVVCLGKPRQEEWVAQYGRGTRARLFLPFGAAVDFMAGTRRRAPRWMQQAGLEWLYRLSREPRRLARRYLIQAPIALMQAARAEVVVAPGGAPSAAVANALPSPERAQSVQSL